MVSIFNRSHYEDVVVVKVHELAAPDVVERRYEQINAFEKHLSDCGTRILKFLLVISRGEQKKRLQSRLDRPEKNWKFNPKDLDDRARWDDFMHAYEIAINRCAAPHAPWYVIPANRRWHRNAAVAHVTRRTLEEMNPVFPKIDFDPASIRIP
jgi:polyphosphate kinase 2 (PPK2 family)